MFNFFAIFLFKSLYFLLKVLAIATNIVGYLQVAFWTMAGEKQIRKIRQRLFEAILRQNIGWYDLTKGGELSNKLTE